MAIEDVLAHIEAQLDRIAKSVERLAFGDEGPGKSAKTGSAKSSKSSAKSKTTTVGAKKKEDPNAPTKVELRAKLQEVQKAINPATAKSILKAEGASTLTQLDTAKYVIVMEMCDKALADA
jgi:hypothetical protein